MNIWVTSDNHFGHENIHKFCGRPRGYEELILKNIGNVIKSGDVVINLGDFAWTENGHWTKMYLAYTMGAKNWLVKGNHDNDSIQTLLNRGWGFVADSIEIDVYGRKIVFSHKPQEDNGYDINIHGHFHNIPVSHWKTLEPELYNIRNKKQYLVSLEDNGYTLENVQNIIGYQQRKEANETEKD